MNPVVHFEMPYEDKERMAAFYTKVFGWKPNMLGPDMEDYVVVDTCEVGEDKFPKKPGMINGGFFKKPDDPTGQHPSVVIAVPDINAALNGIKDAGGTVLGDPSMIPGVGWYGGFIDTEGNRVSVIQPTQM